MTQCQNAQSTVVGLKAQDCPGGGFNGMPKDAEPTVALCLEHGVCGCIYGDAVQHIERLQAALKQIADMADEENEWDGRDRFREARTFAQFTLSAAEQLASKEG